MSSEENKSLFNRFGEALNARSFDEIRDLVAPDFVRHCQATPDVVIKNREQFVDYLKMDAAVFPYSVQTAELVVAEGDFVAFWLKYEGTQKGQMGPFPPSNNRMLLDVGGIFRIENGKLAELWIIWDNLASLAQLGHFPPKSP
jgi:predicted ester cyclase